MSATLAGTGRLIAAPGGAKKEIQGGERVEPLRIRTGNRDRQRPCGADGLSARVGPTNKQDRRGRIMLKRFRNQRGAALIETAITLPLVLLVSVAFSNSAAPIRRGRC